MMLLVAFWEMQDPVFRELDPEQGQKKSKYLVVFRFDFGHSFLNRTLLSPLTL